VPLRMADSNHRRTTEESQRPADERRRCGDAEGLRPERGHEGSDLGATGAGVERARDRPPARARPEHGQPLAARTRRHRSAGSPAPRALAEPRRARGDLARDRPWPLGARDRPGPRSLPRDHRSGDQPLRRSDPLPRPRGGPRGPAPAAPAAPDEARALPRAPKAGRRAPARGPLSRADRRLAAARLPRQ
jgi:hypothetical protein